MLTKLRDLPKSIVPSVLRATRMLDMLSTSRDPLSLGELSIRLDLPKSSALGICTTLTGAGLMKRFENGTYHLGTHLVDLAHAYLSRINLVGEFDQVVDALKVLREDAVVLAVRDGTEVIYVASRNDTLPVGISYRIGKRLPASCTATGKAMLSTLNDRELRQLYRGKRLPRLTANSCRSINALLDELKAIRRQGYALDDEETRKGICCLGVPVVDPAGGPALGAVSVGMLKGTMTAQKRGFMVATLQELATLLLHRMQIMH